MIASPSPIYRRYDSRRRPSFHELSACIRLGRKYQVDHIVDKAMMCIWKAYPKDFPSYLKRAMLCQEHTIGVMNLAQFVGAADIFPVAVLGGCALFGTDLVRGFVRPNRTRKLLYPFDLATCFEAKGQLMRENARRLRRVTEFKPSPKCDGGGCHLAEATFATSMIPRQASRHGWGLSVNVCAGCLKAWEGQVLAYRRDVWNRLPHILGLDVPDGWVTG